MSSGFRTIRVHQKDIGKDPSKNRIESSLTISFHIKIESLLYHKDMVFEMMFEMMFELHIENMLL